MSNVFIVRAFGNNRPVIKKNKEGKPEIEYFNFDKVETDLIKPAMQQLGLTGGTTGEVFEAGDIREDMFSELLLADIVIADITIYNANVFYELGIRHALRDKRTVLIKCPGYDETPFDIIGLRYVSYNKDNPAEALEVLKKSISETLKADRKDSPVFNVLPHLEAQDTEKYLIVPKEFIEEVTIATDSRSAGKLALLAYEAASFAWEIPALRLIGESLYKIKAFASAKIVWERIKDDKPDDKKANEILATVYQRLAEMEMKINPDEATKYFTKSNLAIDALMECHDLSPYEKAEALSLKARNYKTSWVNSWSGLSGEDFVSKAIQSLDVENAFENYQQGFYICLNHYYAGINALGLLTTIISLAEKNPQIWEINFDDKKTADQKLEAYKNKQLQLITALQLSIESAKTYAKEDERIWAYITEADFALLTSNNPARVTAIYKKVIAGANGLNMDAAVRQLKIYEALDVKTDNVKAALAAITIEDNKQPVSIHYLLFTGHMIDKADRKEPRFPASKEKSVREEIAKKVLSEKNKLEANVTLMGIAGGACGGDILFHEVCAELGIKTHMYLALPRDQFIVESVAFADSDWIERFDKLFTQIPHPVLADDIELPKWLSKKENYNIWVRNNLWLLYSAMVNGGMNMSLIALWDGKGGDGAGGTEDMVKVAKANAAKTYVIDMTTV